LFERSLIFDNSPVCAISCYCCVFFFGSHYLISGVSHPKEKKTRIMSDSCGCCGECSTGAKVAITIGSVIGAIIFAVLIGVSFSIVEFYQIGLAYNANTARVDLSRVYTSGRYALGPGFSFITFPSTLQTITETISTRSQDGA
jgi:hypothetical protein